MALAKRRARAIVKQERGAALLTVLVALMIITIMLFEFQYSSMVERKLAYNEINQLQAYYLAKSGVRIGLLRVALYGRARKDPSLKNIAGGMDIRPFLEMIWNLPLPAFPPEKGALGQMLKDDKDAAEKALAETKITEGQFSTVITSESSKINLNFLQSQDQAPKRPEFINPKGMTDYIARMLVELMNNFLAQSDRPYEEYPDLRPEEQVMDIMDWINKGSERLAGGNKDAWYEQQKPPYKAKRNRFYTIDELKLVRGMSDHLFTKLKPYVTVYSYDGRININSAGETIFKALYKDFTEEDVKRILEERNRIGGAWFNETDFVNFVSNNLGRSGFKTLYNNPQAYPFTVASQSFIIESLGSIKKSKSEVQKIIRVAVALTMGKGGQPVNIPQQQCVAPNYFWDFRDPNLPASCRTMPRNQNDCISLGGGWNLSQTAANQFCCYFSNNRPPPVCPGGASGAPGQQGQPTQQQQQGGNSQAVEANSLKILSWEET